MTNLAENIILFKEDIQTSLNVMEQFLTIQGEGYYTGNVAYFIRLGGCDVECFWCDVKDSWDKNKHPNIEISTLVTNVKNSGASICVITGGEPLLQNLDLLTKELLNIGVRTHIETSGSSSFSGQWDWITLSPKKFKMPLDEAYPLASELKIIVFNKKDFEWAKELAKKVRPDCHLYLQTEWDKREEITPILTKFVMENPKWKISVQTHKYLGID